MDYLLMYLSLGLYFKLYVSTNTLNNNLSMITWISNSLNRLWFFKK